MGIYYVKDLNKSIRILPLIQIRDCIIYLCVYHPELNLFQNVIVNIGVQRIEQKVAEAETLSKTTFPEEKDFNNA